MTTTPRSPPARLDFWEVLFMDYLTLGPTGLKVSRLCLGCMTYGVPERGPHPWTLDEENSRAVVDRVGDIAKARGLPRVQIALAWVLHQPVVTSPIIGASKPHHLDDAIGALSVSLSEEELAALEEPSIPHPVVALN